MCLSVPGKVIKVDEGWAIIQGDNHTHKASLSLLKDVKVGDYLLVHADLAINKVEKEEAGRILQMIKKLNHAH